MWEIRSPEDAKNLIPILNRVGTGLFCVTSLSTNTTPPAPESAPQKTEEDLLHEGLAKRPKWSDYYLGLAFVASRRSHDQHTKHGCILVDPRSKRVLATGYNGHPRGGDSDKLPLSRPYKYDFMDHAEPNAIANLLKDPYDVDGGLGPVAYITGTPCFECAKHLTRSNIKRWVLAERRGHTIASLDKTEQFNLHVTQQGVCMERVVPNLNWLVDPGFIDELKEYGFVEANSTL